MRASPLIFVSLGALLLAAAGRALSPGAFILAGEPVRFDAQLRPQFSERQIRGCSDAARTGLAEFAATEHGRMLIAYFNRSEYEIVVTEDPAEDGIGRAPQPGIATLVSASDHSRTKVYELILNPGYFRQMPKGMAPLANQPATPADLMAAAWAGEMLHIYFYAQGISLPHHPRPDFQSDWRAIAAELGMPALRHDDGDEMVAARRPIRRSVYGVRR